jgi:hypothetical protein
LVRERWPVRKDISTKDIEGTVTRAKNKADYEDEFEFEFDWGNEQGFKMAIFEK